ncbi:MAG: hypothetical protein SGI73_06085 [Chloroflexota bacterium]|nr:hypothetical protein [Chloroflexota bacterium]
MQQIKLFVGKWLALFTLLFGAAGGYFVAQNAPVALSRVAVQADSQPQLITCPMGHTGTCP